MTSARRAPDERFAATMRRFAAAVTTGSAPAPILLTHNMEEETMKNHCRILAATLLLVWWAPGVSAQNGYDLFQQALRKERTEGNCAEAIALYEQVAREARDNRELAAQALVRAGECHEKLGQDAARKAYQRVVAEFSDQREQAAIARERLAALNPRSIRATGIVTKKIFDRDSSGAPSPNGRHLTFVNWTSANLAVRDMTTGEDRDLTDEGSWTANSRWAETSVWSRDGRQIAYSWFNPGAELRVIEARGGRPQVVDQAAHVRPVDWTSDGKAILALRRTSESDSMQLVFITVANGSARAVMKLDDRPIRASLSPDDRYVLLDVPERPGDQARDILLVSSDGTRQERIVAHAAVDYGPMWLPDGSGFVFVSDRGGSSGLWLQRMREGRTQGAPELIKADMGRMFPLGFSRDGTLFYGYAAFNNAGDIYLARLDASGRFIEKPRLAVQQHLASNTSGDISPDGKRLAYLSRRGALPIGSGSWSVVVRSLESGEEQIVGLDLLEILNPRAAPLRWSPDSRSLLVIGIDASRRSGLFALDVESGGTRLLVEGAGGPRLNWPTWSPAGDKVYYSVTTPGPEGVRYRIEALDLQSGTRSEIGRGRTFAVSPDGGWVAIPFADKDGFGIRVAPTTGGESREILRQRRMCNFYTGLAWTPDGKHILFGDTEAEGLPIRLARIPVDGGAPQPLGVEALALRDLSLSRDGRMLTYTAGSAHRAEVWTLENLRTVMRAMK
jgi:Tol biopolymer transport system component